MKKINDFELNTINGGISGWTVVGISLLVTFLAGVMDGVARPIKCRG